MQDLGGDSYGIHQVEKKMEHELKTGVIPSPLPTKRHW